MLTVSDSVVARTREDASGDTLQELLEADGYDVTRRAVADERGQISTALAELAAGAQLAGRRGREARDQPKQRRLARAVRPRHERERAAVDVEVEPAQDALGAVASLKTARVDHVCAWTVV